MRIVLVLIAVLLVTGCSGSVVSSEPTPTAEPTPQATLTPSPTPEPTPTATPTPAEFVLSNLQVELGEGEHEYSITVDVENIGGTTGIYELTQKYDDKIDPEFSIIEVELNPDEKQTIALEYLQSCAMVSVIAYEWLVLADADELGDKEHTISVDGLSQTIVFVEPTPTPTPSPQLEVLNWHWSREYSYIIAEGEVRNISDQKLDNVLAVLRYYTADYTFVTSDDALIDYNPIMPGQTSPFKVYTTDNPLIKSGGLSFRHLMGGAISVKK